MVVVIIGLACIGFFLSLYAYFVEKKIKSVSGYKPLCNISDSISCAKPFMSQYAHILYFSNSLVGMVFYVLIIILALLNAVPLLMIAAVGGGVASGVLTYLLYVKVKSFCVVCASIYIINFLILILVLAKFF